MNQTFKQFLMESEESKSKFKYYSCATCKAGVYTDKEPKDDKVHCERCKKMHNISESELTESLKTKKQRKVSMEGYMDGALANPTKKLRYKRDLYTQDVDGKIYNCHPARMNDDGEQAYPIRYELKSHDEEYPEVKAAMDFQRKGDW